MRSNYSRLWSLSGIERQVCSLASGRMKVAFVRRFRHRRLRRKSQPPEALAFFFGLCLGFQTQNFD